MKQKWPPPHDGQPHSSGKEKYAHMHRVVLVRAFLYCSYPSQLLASPVAICSSCLLAQLTRSIATADRQSAHAVGSPQRASIHNLAMQQA
jgi:hypothetical protein